MPDAEKNDLSASVEDYLEAIFNLADQSGGAHSKDIAKQLNVSRSSVTGALRLLRKKGLANYKPYDCVTLTEAGQQAAAQVAQKHGILKSFFVDVLGIDAEIAQQAACRAEHSLGPKVIARLLNFIEFVTKHSKDGHDLANEFAEFCQSRPQWDTPRGVPLTNNDTQDKRTE